VIRRFSDLVARGTARHGERFDPSELAEEFRRYYETGERIRVVTTYGQGESAETYTRTGTVGVTTGWRPAFLLIHRSSDHGSSDLLSDRDRVVAVKRGREYVPVRRYA
jgi:hypothetical protein